MPKNKFKLIPHQNEINPLDQEETPIVDRPRSSETRKPVRFLILGRSGSGKSSLAVNPVISYTTRPQRGPEDTDHYFIRPDQVANYPHKIAYTKIGSYEYFATQEELNRSLCYIIDYDGLRSLQAPQYEWISVYVSVSPKIQLERLRSRGDSTSAIKRRLEAEDSQFRTLERLEAWDYRIDNNHSLDDAQEQLFRIIQFEGDYPTNQERYYFQRKYFQYSGPNSLQDCQTRWGYAYRTFSGGFVTLVPQKTGTYHYKIIAPDHALSQDISRDEFQALRKQYQSLATPILITDLWNGQKGCPTPIV